MRSRKGFTLVEIMVVVALLGIVFVFASNVLNLGAKAMGASNREFELQSGVRLAAATSTEKIRYSKTIFTIPKSSFRKDNLSPNWDYFGIEDVTVDSRPASQIVQYTWNPATLVHDELILVEPKPDVKYEFAFSKEYTYAADGSIEQQNLLNYKIVTYLNGVVSADPYISVDGQSFAANALQIIDYGTSYLNC
jgi:prepilin-type N-terminal cleavage/methylation domain-containing protein